MSTVDVIVPCYNYGRYLRQCVESVLSQEGVDVRVLIIDDCSPDNTPEIAAELVRQHSRVEYRRHTANQGHIATYNEGLEWISNDHVLLISADDCLTPAALLRAVEVFHRHSQVGLVYGRDIVFDTDQPPTCEARVREGLGWKISTYEEFLEESCRLGHTGIQAPCVVIRTPIHKRAGGYLRQLPHTADTEIWLRIAAHAPVAILDADQAFRRLHPRNMSLSYQPLERLREQYSAFEIHFRKFGDQIREVDRLVSLLRRTIGEAAFWGGARAFERGDIGGAEDHLDFAAQVFPAIRSSRAWRRFRLKRLVGFQTWSRLSRLRQCIGTLVRGRPDNTSPTTYDSTIRNRSVA